MKHLLSAGPLRAWLVALLLGMGVGRAAWAQLPSTTLDPTDNIVRPQTDTARVAKPLTRQQKREAAAADSALKTERLFGLHVTRPQKAALLALAPGAGQIYNKKYWKLPLVYGLLGTLGTVEYFFQTHYHDYVTAKDSLALSKGRVKFGDSSLNSAKVERTPQGIESGIRFYRGNRDLYILLFAAGYSLQILDAVVDAHLHNFDVGDDLTLDWQPALLPIAGQLLPGVGATVTLRVK